MRPSGARQFPAFLPFVLNPVYYGLAAMYTDSGVEAVNTRATRVPAGDSEVQKGFLVCDAGEKAERKVPVGAAIVVGRTVDCGLVIDDAAASRRHLEILARQEGFFWKDLGSTNGTLLNGSRMLEGRLRNGESWKPPSKPWTRSVAPSCSPIFPHKN
ncbi:MAG: FHA domain-containing protein [Candidatus Hydrogenedentes bacterium]|nr:FHA domain-containing protein [Candidatus Hydrogenedentota bacterium]